jgi:predicted GIY-YIG superfamily endonuclease
MSQYHVYLLKCIDGTYYTGIAIDVEERVRVHNAGKGAVYTRSRRPVVPLAATRPMSHGDALRLERRIKKMKRKDKLNFINKYI